MAGAASFFGSSATVASVVIKSPATDAASCSAARTTLAGTMMPCLEHVHDLLRLRLTAAMRRPLLLARLERLRNPSRVSGEQAGHDGTVRTSSLRRPFANQGRAVVRGSETRGAGTEPRSGPVILSQVAPGNPDPASTRMRRCRSSAITHGRLPRTAGHAHPLTYAGSPRSSASTC